MECTFSEQHFFRNKNFIHLITMDFYAHDMFFPSHEVPTIVFQRKTLTIPASKNHASNKLNFLSNTSREIIGTSGVRITKRIMNCWTKLFCLMTCIFLIPHYPVWHDAPPIQSHYCCRWFFRFCFEKYLQHLLGMWRVEKFTIESVVGISSAWF